MSRPLRPIFEYIGEISLVAKRSGGSFVVTPTTDLNDRLTEMRSYLSPDERKALDADLAAAAQAALRWFIRLNAPDYVEHAPLLSPARAKQVRK